MTNVQLGFIIVSVIAVLVSCLQAWTLFQRTKLVQNDVLVNKDNKKGPHENTANYLRFTTDSVDFIPKDKEANFQYINNTLYYRLDPDKKNTAVCGRSPDADIRFQNDFFVSKMHFVIKYENKLWFIQDLNSSNGTYLNDMRITESTPLKSGDKITVGKENIFVEYAVSPSITTVEL